jgi:hypothetical protein
MPACSGTARLLRLTVVVTALSFHSRSRCLVDTMVEIERLLRLP